MNEQQMKLITVVFGIIIFFMIIGIAGFVYIISYDKLHNLREPNTYELFYAEAATDSGVPGICSKISPSAYTSAAWGEPGFQVSFIRSRCFSNVAQETGNSSLCNNVKPLNRLFLDGSKAAQYCLESAGKKGGSFIMITGDQLRYLLHEMGDTQAENSFYAKRDIFNQLEQVYNNAKNEKKFLLKVSELPDYDKDSSENEIREGNFNEFFYQQVAVDFNLTSFCDKISSNAYFNQIYHINHSITKISLKDNCYMSIALNKDNILLCNQIVQNNSRFPGQYASVEHCKLDIEFNNKKPDLSYCELPQIKAVQDPEQCRQQLLKQSQNNIFYYGPVKYTNQHYANALRGLGYNLSLQISDEALHEYYFSVMISQNISEKKDFINRILKLPSFS